MNYEIKTIKKKARRNTLVIAITSLVFFLSFLTLLVYFTVFKVEKEEEIESEEIEMVFKELGIYEVLDFDKIEKTSRDVYDFSAEK